MKILDRFPIAPIENTPKIIKRCDFTNIIKRCKMIIGGGIMSKIFKPIECIFVKASEPHPINTEYRIAFGKEIMFGGKAVFFYYSYLKILSSLINVNLLRGYYKLILSS